MSEHKEASAWFNELYKKCERDESQVPWATMTSHKFLDEYIASHAANGKALVVGCGLGDDAMALHKAGYDVTAIDISESAIEWCEERFNEHDIKFRVHDIFEMPEEMLESFDFIFESRTIQSFPLAFRNRIIEAISALAKKDGKIFVVANGKLEGEEIQGPPWPLERNEVRLFENYGMQELEFSIFANEDDNAVSKFLFRALYQKM